MSQGFYLFCNTKYFISMRKIVIVSLMIFISGFASCQDYKLEGIIENYPGRKVYLSDFYGDQNKIIDSVKTGNNGSFQFSFSESQPAGMYRLFYGDKSFIDVIFNHEDVELLTSINDPFENTEIIRSNENLLFYDYLKFNSSSLYKIDLLQPLVRYYPKDDPFALTVRNEYVKLQDDLHEYIDSIASNYPSSYTSKIALMERQPKIIPDLSAFEQRIYLKLHYFDGADFSDTSLLRSNVISSKLIGYLSLYQNSNLTKDQLENEFIKAVDTILSKVSVNRYVYEFALDYLIGGFDKYNFNRVIEYIAEKSILEEFCEYTEQSSELEKRIETLKRLAIGKEAPDFEVIDLDGKSITLSEIDKDYVVLIFWASWCPHCTQVLPKLRDFYKRQDIDYLEVISISIDTSMSDYQDFIEVGGYNWINVCDYKGWESDPAKLFGIYATPTLILLDNNRKILAKPGTIGEIEAIINK